MSELLAILTAVNIQVNTSMEYEYRLDGNGFRNGLCPEIGNCADHVYCKAAKLAREGELLRRGLKPDVVTCWVPDYDSTKCPQCPNRRDWHMVLKVGEYYLDNRFDEVRTFTDCK